MRVEIQQRKGTKDGHLTYSVESLEFVVALVGKNSHVELASFASPGDVGKGWYTPHQAKLVANEYADKVRLFMGLEFPEAADPKKPTRARPLDEARSFA